MILKAAGQMGGNPYARPVEHDEMVQDPHCKVFVPMKRAISVRSGDETLYFCSEDCAKKHIGGMGGNIRKSA